jgi:hypothetical protein
MFVFKNKDDSIRFNIHKRHTSLGIEWDVDVWTKNEGGRTIDLVTL